MLDFFRNRQMMTATASAVMISTVFDVGLCIADTKTDISVANELGADIVIRFSGAASLEQLNPYTVRKTPSAHKLGSVPENTTVKWEGTLDDKTVCKGDKKAAGLKTTITISKDMCKAPPAAPAPKPSTPNDKAASTAGGSLTIRFSNVTSQVVVLHIKDLVNHDPAPFRSEINAGLTPEGKVAGAKNYLDYPVKTDKDGKYRLQIDWQCKEHGGGGGGIYKDKETRAAILNPKDADKTAKDECTFMGMGKE